MDARHLVDPQSPKFNVGDLSARRCDRCKLKLQFCFHLPPGVGTEQNYEPHHDKEWTPNIEAGGRGGGGAATRTRSQTCNSSSYCNSCSTDGTAQGPQAFAPANSFEMSLRFVSDCLTKPARTPARPRCRLYKLRWVLGSRAFVDAGPTAHRTRNVQASTEANGLRDRRC